MAQGALWNSGMFVWQAATFLRAATAFAPSVVDLVQRVMDGDIAAWDRIPKQSVDFGVMEPASVSAEFTVAALPLSARWLDVGSWPQYGDALPRDADGNAVSATAVVLDSRDNVVASSDPAHLVALVGCEGLVVVHTPSATLRHAGFARPAGEGPPRAGEGAAPRPGLTAGTWETVAKHPPCACDHWSPEPLCCSACSSSRKPAPPRPAAGLSHPRASARRSGRRPQGSGPSTSAASTSTRARPRSTAAGSTSAGSTTPRSRCR